MQDGFFGGIGFFAIKIITDNIGNGDVEMLGKSKVPLIAAGHGHDGAGAIARQHILRNPDGYFPAVERVDGVCPRKATCNLFYFG